MHLKHVFGINTKQVVSFPEMTTANSSGTVQVALSWYCTSSIISQNFSYMLK